MKRGLITWNSIEMPAEAFAARLDRARALLETRRLPALVVYTDLWRSNGVRYLTNFMPYWSRSLLVVPASGEPVLVCGLAARGYPWIKSVTTLQDIRPAKQLGRRLAQLAEERGWQEVGIVDSARLPHDIRGEINDATLRIVDVPAELPAQWVDSTEISLRRRAADIARESLQTVFSGPPERSADRLGAAVERACRLKGAADVHVWIGDGVSVPGPPAGRTLQGSFCVTVACDYLGHSAIVSRIKHADGLTDTARERFQRIVGSGTGPLEPTAIRHDLSDADSWIARDPRSSLHPGSIVAIQIEHQPGSRLFHGDTCVATGPWTATVL